MSADDPSDGTVDQPKVDAPQQTSQANHSQQDQGRADEQSVDDNQDQIDDSSTDAIAPLEKKDPVKNSGDALKLNPSDAANKARQADRQGDTGNEPQSVTAEEGTRRGNASFMKKAARGAGAVALSLWPQTFYKVAPEPQPLVPSAHVQKFAPAEVSDSATPAKVTMQSAVASAVDRHLECSATPADIGKRVDVVSAVDEDAKAAEKATKEQTKANEEFKEKVDDLLTAFGEKIERDEEDAPPEVDDRKKEIRPT